MTSPQGPIATTGEGPGSVPIPPVPVVVREKRRWYQFPAGASLLGRAFYLVLLTFLTAIFLYPFLWMVSASLKPREEVFDNRLIPRHWQPSNYLDVFRGVENISVAAPFGRWFFNSMWIGCAAALSVTVSSALVAFAFAYFRFPVLHLLFGCVVAMLVLPGAVTMIPV